VRRDGITAAETWTMELRRRAARQREIGQQRGVGAGREKCAGLCERLGTARAGVFIGACGLSRFSARRGRN
jgi:hypothetical protein